MIDHEQQKNIDLCVVLPVCDEEESIVTVVGELCSVLMKIQTLKRVALIVVDDYSQDKGITVLKQWFCKKQLPGYILTIIRLRQRHGVSMALLRGFKLAATWSPHLTMVMDADGQDNPDFAADLIAKASEVDIVCALRGKRSESLFFRFCYTSFQFFMKISTGSYARTNQFCVLRQPALTYVANMKFIDYLGALLDAAPFSRDTLIAARRRRLAGMSKFSFFDHALTAVVIVSWKPRLVNCLNITAMIIIAVIGITALVTNDPIAIIVTVLVATIAHLYNLMLTRVLLRRANSYFSKFDEHIEEIIVYNNTFPELIK